MIELIIIYPPANHNTCLSSPLNNLIYIMIFWLNFKKNIHLFVIRNRRIFLQNTLFALFYYCVNISFCSDDGNFNATTWMELDKGWIKVTTIYYNPVLR